jgi:hypothetical protein
LKVPNRLYGKLRVSASDPHECVPVAPAGTPRVSQAEWLTRSHGGGWHVCARLACRGCRGGLACAQRVSAAQMGRFGWPGTNGQFLFFLSCCRALSGPGPWHWQPQRPPPLAGPSPGLWVTRHGSDRAPGLAVNFPWRLRSPRPSGDSWAPHWHPPGDG